MHINKDISEVNAIMLLCAVTLVITHLVQAFPWFYMWSPVVCAWSCDFKWHSRCCCGDKILCQHYYMNRPDLVVQGAVCWGQVPVACVTPVSVQTFTQHCQLVSTDMSLLTCFSQSIGSNCYTLGLVGLCLVPRGRWAFFLPALVITFQVCYLSDVLSWSWLLFLCI